MTIKFRRHPSLHLSLVLAALSYVAACSSSSSSDDDGASGGKGGSASGGKGGKGGNASGGKGGSAAGGNGGESSGGSGGSAGGGGSASGGGGGSASGGAATGGAGGASMTGGATGTGGTPSEMGGSTGAVVVDPGPAGPAVAAEGVFFSGKDMNVTKLVAADAQPGYVYASPNIVDGAKVVDISADAAGLPDGTKYAYLMNAPKGTLDNVIIGWNWRMDTSAKKWNYADLSAFKGISFWWRNELGVAGFSFFPYENTNFTADVEAGGVCPATPCPDLFVPPAAKAIAIARKTWSQITYNFADLMNTAGQKANPKNQGRVDLLQLNIGMLPVDEKIYITGIQLVK